MGNNPRQRCVQAGAPRISSTLGDRGAEADASGKHEVKRRHVVRKRSAGGGARLRTDESRPAGGTSTSVFRGEDAVADFANSVSNLPEPIQGKVALQVAPKMTITVAFHSRERGPPSAVNRAVVRTRSDWAVPAAWGCSTAFGDRGLGRIMGNGTTR